MNRLRELRSTLADLHAALGSSYPDEPNVESEALEGDDWGAEAQPKLTEFGTDQSTRRMVSTKFDRVV